MDNNIGKILRENRIASNITVKEISARLTDKGYKASEKTIYSWESGNSQPSPEALLEMCDAYGIKNILQTFGYDGYKKDGSLDLNIHEQELIEMYRSLDDPGRTHVDTILQWETERMEGLQKQTDGKIITLMEVESHRDPSLILPYWESGVSAGNGIYQLNDTASVMMTLWATELTKRADFIIKVSGSSMEPDYHDGDKVLVSKMEHVDIGDVGIFVKNGDTFIKEMGEKELISRNPEYPNIPVNDFDNVVCLGKVIGTLRENMIVKN